MAAGDKNWQPKILREMLCRQVASVPDAITYRTVNDLITLIDLHRPLGPDGKHGDLHTPTCGCEDK